MKKNSVFWKICWMISFTVIVFTGCESEEDPKAEQSPEIPPLSTFMADLVTSQKHFEDEVWHCWDSSLENIDC